MAIPLPGIHIQEMKTPTQMFIETLFAMASNQKQHKYSSTGEWINTVWCIHNIIQQHERIIYHMEKKYEFQSIVQVKGTRQKRLVLLNV